MSFNFRYNVLLFFNQKQIGNGNCGLIIGNIIFSERRIDVCKSSQVNSDRLNENRNYGWDCSVADRRGKTKS